jgi:hypothetical protein
MALKPTDKNWGNNKKVNYIGKDFATIKENLVEFTKTYFPDTYSDFNEASPGMVFIEQAAAVGDLLSFYQDTQLKESMLAYATERKNVMALAQTMGYKPKVTTPAVTTLTVYQLCPALGGPTYGVDERFYLKLKEGLEVASTSNRNVTFRTTDVVDFANSTSREIDVYERDTLGNPQFYLITKKVKAISATQASFGINFTADDNEYPTATIPNTNIIS